MSANLPGILNLIRRQSGGGTRPKTASMADLFKGGVLHEIDRVLNRVPIASMAFVARLRQGVDFGDSAFVLRAARALTGLDSRPAPSGEYAYAFAVDYIRCYYRWADLVRQVAHALFVFDRDNFPAPAQFTPTMAELLALAPPADSPSLFGAVKYLGVIMDFTEYAEVLHVCNLKESAMCRKMKEARTGKPLTQTELGFLRVATVAVAMRELRQMGIPFERRVPLLNVVLEFVTQGGEGPRKPDGPQMPHISSARFSMQMAGGGCTTSLVAFCSMWKNQNNRMARNGTAFVRFMYNLYCALVQVIELPLRGFSYTHTMRDMDDGNEISHLATRLAFVMKMAAAVRTREKAATPAQRSALGDFLASSAQGGSDDSDDEDGTGVACAHHPAPDAGALQHGKWVPIILLDTPTAESYLKRTLNDNALERSVVGNGRTWVFLPGADAVCLAAFCARLSGHCLPPHLVVSAVDVTCNNLGFGALVGLNEWHTGPSASNDAITLFSLVLSRSTARLNFRPPGSVLSAYLHATDLLHHCDVRSGGQVIGNIVALLGDAHAANINKQGRGVFDVLAVVSLLVARFPKQWPAQQAAEFLDTHVFSTFSAVQTESTALELSRDGAKDLVRAYCACVVPSGKARAKEFVAFVRNAMTDKEAGDSPINLVQWQAHLLLECRTWMKLAALFLFAGSLPTQENQKLQLERGLTFYLTLARTTTTRVMRARSAQPGQYAQEVRPRPVSPLPGTQPGSMTKLAADAAAASEPSDYRPSSATLNAEVRTSVFTQMGRLLGWYEARCNQRTGAIEVDKSFEVVSITGEPTTTWPVGSDLMNYYPPRFSTVVPHASYVMDDYAGGMNRALVTPRGSALVARARGFEARHIKLSHESYAALVPSDSVADLARLVPAPPSAPPTTASSSRKKIMDAAQMVANIQQRFQASSSAGGTFTSLAAIMTGSDGPGDSDSDKDDDHLFEGSAVVSRASRAAAAASSSGSTTSKKKKKGRNSPPPHVKAKRRKRLPAPDRSALTKLTPSQQMELKRGNLVLSKDLSLPALMSRIPNSHLITPRLNEG